LVTDLFRKLSLDRVLDGVRLVALLRHRDREVMLVLLGAVQLLGLLLAQLDAELTRLLHLKGLNHLALAVLQNDLATLNGLLELNAAGILGVVCATTHLLRLGNGLLGRLFSGLLDRLGRLRGRLRTAGGSYLAGT